MGYGELWREYPGDDAVGNRLLNDWHDDLHSISTLCIR